MVQMQHLIKMTIGRLVNFLREVTVETVRIVIFRTALTTTAVSFPMTTTIIIIVTTLRSEVIATIIRSVDHGDKVRHSPNTLLQSQQCMLLFGAEKITRLSTKYLYGPSSILLSRHNTRAIGTYDFDHPMYLLRSTK